MAKEVYTAVLDAALDEISTNVTKMIPAVSGSYTIGGIYSGTFASTATMAPTDFTKGAGTIDSLGRKLTVAQKLSVTIDNSLAGCNQILLLDSSNTVYYATEMSPSVDLVGGGNFTFDSWEIEFGAPT